MKNKRSQLSKYLLLFLIKANCDAHCHFQHCPGEVRVQEFRPSLGKFNSNDFNISVKV